MNGKNRRTRGCWSRGNTVFKSTIRMRRAPGIKYNLPVFSSRLKTGRTNNQKNLLNEFEHYTYLPKYEEYAYNSNTPRALIRLRNSHFTNGTVRITKPGIYILQEDIVFEPNADHDFFPTYSQSILTKQFPMGTEGAYHLGFFAAITVETTGVILDLNSHTIKQSKLHNLQQRFYANIELASAPFIPAQGPATFSTNSNYVAANALLIRNGTLGLSSHHGIHGNAMSNIVIDNVTIEDFEVAGIALNGTTTGIINKTTVRNASQTIPILSTYSQSRFIRSFLTDLSNNPNHPNASIRIEGVETDVNTIISNLNAALNTTKNEIMQSGETTNTLFKNTSQLYDGNLYGIVLNEKGVVVNGFIRNRDDAIGNVEIHLQDITISNLVSQPVEIIGLSNPNPPPNGAYGSSSQAGPIGDILQIENITDAGHNNIYKPTVLSNAQLIIAKYNTPKKGTTSITSETVQWAKDPSNLDIMMSSNYYSYVNGGDSMGHIMKGSLGLFISAGKNITGDTITISGVATKGTQVGTSPLIHDLSQNYQGAVANGILFTGSETVTLTNTTVDNITSDTPAAGANKIYSINSSGVSNNGENVPNDEI